jgi:hypothetical protein
MLFSYGIGSTKKHISYWKSSKYEGKLSNQLYYNSIENFIFKCY